MYRFMNYKILMLASCVFLSACGQSGALHLPNDPNYDKRAKYLLYRNDNTAQLEQKDAAQPQPSQAEELNSPTTP